MEEPKSYSIEKLNESNYRSWSQIIESHLDDQDLWGVVTGKETTPTPPSAATTEVQPSSSLTQQSPSVTTPRDYETQLELWSKKVKRARKIIISTISPSIMVYVEGRKDPAEMWKILEERYKPKTRVTLRQLQRQFNTIKLSDDDGDMEKHLQKVEGLKRQIEEQGEEISDSSYISILLNCAPSRYDIQISILEAQDEITPAIIINRLLEEYRKYLVTRQDKTITALISNGGRGKKGSSYKRNSKFEGKCNHCNKRGHKEDQCWIKHPDLKPEKGRDGKEHPKFSMMATMRSKGKSDSSIWYTDSGASDHFSPYKELFQTFHIFKEPAEIETAEGTATGTAKGTIRITVIGGDNKETELELSNVIYAPNMSSNLFSLMAAYDHGYETRITPGHGLRILYNDVLVAQTTREQGGLFRLNTTPSSLALIARVPGSIPDLDVNIWHRRLAHLSEDNVRKLAAMVKGMSIRYRTAVGVCDACMEGKQHRQPSHQPATRAVQPLELIHSDLCGPIDPTSFGGAMYFILFIDDGTRYTYIYLLKRKTSNSVLERFQEYKAEVEKQLGRNIKRLRTDGGGEYENWMGNYLKGSGIIHETTAPYSPDQNGVAERANRTILERVKSIISEGKLDKQLWMELAQTVVYLKNRSPTTAVSTTPYEAWHGVKPDLSHLRILGSTVYIHIPKEKRIKLDTHSHKGILVGYGGTNQYRVWDLTREDVVVSRDVRFKEGISVMDGAVTSPISEEPRIVHDSITVLPAPQNNGQLPTPPATEHQDSEPGSDPESSISSGGNNEPTSVDPRLLLQQTEPERRSSSRSNKGTFISPRFIEEGFPKRSPTARIARSINTDDEDEPVSIQEAISHPTRGKQWEIAINDEYNSLIKNKTWELVSRPPNRRVVSCKWALKHKRDEMGRIIRLKARLVARGFSQIYGIDYLDTYAPVVKLASIRILLAIAAVFGLEIHQMDVVTAFLAGDLEQEIYMEQPEGYEMGGQDIVCRLIKSLYGLKQAPRVWNQRIRRYLKSVGFNQTYSDPCVYVNRDTGVLIAMWVDDLIIFGKDMTSIQDLKAVLNKEYEMKDLGELKYFLGIQVHRSKEQKLIHISQSGYIGTLLERYNMQDSNPARVPLSQGTKLTKAAISDTLTNSSEYQSIVGSQMYAMLATRPDLAHSIQQISQHSQKPTVSHLKAASQGLRYLNGTRETGIIYHGKQGLKLEAWSDASWGAEEGRESVSGFVFTLAGGAVSWSSKKQSSVALSSTESEYMALLHAVKEQIWIKRLLNEIGYNIDSQITIYTDSQSAIALAQNPEHHARTKHIDIQYHFVRNCVDDGTLELKYTPTEDMVADGLTKTLAPERHWKLIRMMGIKEWVGKGVEMDANREQEITRMRSGSDERASSQGSQGAKEAKDLALGKAKKPRD
jgi:hypothetical protein